MEQNAPVAIGALYSGLDPDVPAREVPQAIVERLIATLPKRRAPLNLQIRIAYGEPPAEILRLSRSMRANLIVLGNRPRHGIARFIHGSVAERVAQSASCPVLMVPSPRQPVQTRPLHPVGPKSSGTGDSDSLLSWRGRDRTRP